MKILEIFGNGSAYYFIFFSIHNIYIEICTFFKKKHQIGSAYYNDIT